MAIVAAFLAGLPALSSGCARCGGSEPLASPGRAASTQTVRSNPTWRQARREPRRKRWMGEVRLAEFGNSSIVCVRACDGGFFPVPYVGDRESLAKICQALCPNAAVQLYSMPFGGTIEEATSATGLPYAEAPNAGRFEHTFDSTCSCRRKDQSWAEALADAEASAERHSGDILVTPEISDRMSRPAPDSKTSVAAAGADAASVLLANGSEPLPLKVDANGVDLDLHAATAALSRATSGIRVDEEMGGVHYGLKQGQVVEQKEPDGSVRRVRVVAPR